MAQTGSKIKCTVDEASATVRSPGQRRWRNQSKSVLHVQHAILFVCLFVFCRNLRSDNVKYRYLVFSQRRFTRVKLLIAFLSSSKTIWKRKQYFWVLWLKKKLCISIFPPVRFNSDICFLAVLLLLSFNFLHSSLCVIQKMLLVWRAFSCRMQ